MSPPSQPLPPRQNPPHVTGSEPVDSHGHGYESVHAAEPLAEQPGQPLPAVGFMGKVKDFRTRYAQAEMGLFFLGGFTFDALMLDRIDDHLMLWQQVGYLTVVGVVLALAIRHELKLWNPPSWVLKGWHYSDHLMHFMLGTLLNAYTLFYFKSASGLVAVLFLLLIAGLLALNELPYFHKLGPVVLVGLYSFCLTSYFAYLIPVLAGSLRSWMFYSAVGMALLPLALLAWGLWRWTGSLKSAAKEVVIPGLLVQAGLVLLFTFGLIPPVPLALRHIGVYHEVSKAGGGQYTLSHEKTQWRYFDHGDTDFHARASDRIYVFARIFAPAKFRDLVQMRWSHEEPGRGWVKSDAVPLTVTGAKSERGFAGFTYKQHWQPGKWKVELETQDGRDIGAVHFTVTADSDTGPRNFIEDEG